MSDEQFNLFEGRKLRDEGMSTAALNRAQTLRIAQAIAKTIAISRENRTCDIDDVQAEIMKRGLDLGMAAGSVFKEKCWKFVGYKQTERKTSHARHIKLWKLI